MTHKKPAPRYNIKGVTMKKLSAAFLLIVLAFSTLTLTACSFGLDKPYSLEEDSEVTAVTVTCNDGYTFELGKEDIDLIVNEIKSINDNFTTDSKILVQSKWEFEYDYIFTLTVLRKQFFKKTETTMAYALGTIGTYTDSDGKKKNTYSATEWSYHNMANARRTADSTEEKAKAIHERLDGIVSSARQAEYESIKQEFINYGFTVRELESDELLGFDNPFEPGGYFFTRASQGFTATNEDTDEVYTIYYSSRELAKKVYYELDGRKSCRMKDVFIGYGEIIDSEALLNTVFPASEE